MFRFGTAGRNGRGRRCFHRPSQSRRLDWLGRRGRRQVRGNGRTQGTRKCGWLGGLSRHLGRRGSGRVGWRSQRCYSGNAGLRQGSPCINGLQARTGGLGRDRDAAGNGRGNAVGVLQSLLQCLAIHHKAGAIRNFLLNQAGCQALQFWDQTGCHSFSLSLSQLGLYPSFRGKACHRPSLQKRLPQP